MKYRSLKISLPFLLLFAAICTAIFAVPSKKVAEALDYGTVTVTYDGAKYLYSDGAGNGGSDASLQNVIDSVQTLYSEPVFDFDRLPVRTPLVFKKDAVLMGSLYFELNANDSALTVASSATLTLRGPVIDSNCCAIEVEYNGNLQILSGNVTVIDCVAPCSAIDVRGNAFISGCNINYASENTVVGMGISVNGGGNLTVTPDTEVMIAGSSGLCVTAGRAVLNGGRYLANRFDGNSSAGFSVDLQGGELIVNGGEFPHPVYDRTVAGGKLSVNGGNVSSLRVTPDSNKKLHVGALEILTGNSCQLEIGFPSENTLSIEGTKSRNGYRTVGFTVNGVKTDGPLLTVNTDEEKTVVPIEDNRYDLNLSCDGTIYRTLRYTYETVVRLNALPAPEKTGYTLTGWVERKGDFTVREDVTLCAVTELSAPEILFENTELTYNGTEQAVIPTLKHDLNVTYTTYWERLNAGGWERIADGNELYVTAVADSGTYRFTVDTSYAADSNRTSKEVEVTVNKGNYEGVAHPEHHGVYDPDKRLNAYSLEAHFRWVDATTVPSVPLKFYPAIYNADPDNYNDCEIDVKIDLQKAAAVLPPPHKDLSGVYEKKRLKDYPLNNGFRWQTPEEMPVVRTKAYAAFYNPDRDNYEDSARYITLDLTKGNYDDTKRLADMTMTYRKNYYLSDFNGELTAAHANYNLYYSSDEKLNAGTKTLQCTYNDDPENYNDYRFTFSLTVEKTDFSPEEVPQILPINGVYSGLSISEYNLPTNVFWRDPDLIPTVDVQEYDAYYNADRENYNDYPVKLTIILQKGNYDIDSLSLPVLNAITYHKDATLTKIALPSGWVWIDPSVRPTVAVNSYQAEYCPDPVNYFPLAVSLSLTVNKADIESAVLPDKTVTYDGKAHSLELETLPYPLVLLQYENNRKVDAGKYEVTARLSQTDTDNYNLHPATVRGMLTILKAPSVINAPTRYDIVEGATLVIDGTVENNEQNLVIPAFTETAVGIYYVVLSAAESGNYLAGSLTVTVAINKTEKYIGNIKYPSDYDGSYLYGLLLNSDCGVPNDAEISFRPFAYGDYLLGIEISVTVNGTPYVGKFTAKIRMTDEMLSASALTLCSEDETEIPFYVENKVYLVFETDGNDILYLKADSKKDFPWYWIPIGIVMGLIVIGAIFVVLWNKGMIKLPKKANALPKAPPDASQTTADDTMGKTEEHVLGEEESKEENNEKSDLER